MARVKELEDQLAQIELQIDTEKKVRPLRKLAASKAICVTEHITRPDGLFGEPVLERQFKLNERRGQQLK